MGLAPAEELILSSAPEANEKVLRDGSRKVAKTLTVIKARRQGGPLEKLECAGCGEPVREVPGGWEGLKCHFKLIDGAPAAGECEVNTDLCRNRIQRLHDAPVDTF